MFLKVFHFSWVIRLTVSTDISNDISEWDLQNCMFHCCLHICIFLIPYKVGQIHWHRRFFLVMLICRCKQFFRFPNNLWIYFVGAFFGVYCRFLSVYAAFLILSEVNTMVGKNMSKTQYDITNDLELEMLYSSLCVSILYSFWKNIQSSKILLVIK